MWRDVLVEEKVPAARLRLALASAFGVATTDVELVYAVEHAQGRKVVCVETPKPGGFAVLLSILAPRSRGVRPIDSIVVLGRRLGQRLLISASLIGARVDPYIMLLVDNGTLCGVRLDAEALTDEGAYRISSELDEPN